MADDDDVTEACRLVGELCWEHGVASDEPKIYRVTYWRGVGKRRVRCTDYFSKLREALTKVSRIRREAEWELISMKTYTMQAEESP